MFRYRRQLRRWAARVLLLWLFGIGAGVANACWVPNVAQHGGHAAAHASDALVAQDQAAAPGIGHPHGPGHVHAAAGAQDHTDHTDHPDHLAKSNCADFCDKASISIPQLKSALDDLQGHAPPPPAVVTVLPVRAFLSVQKWVSRRDGVWAPPISIAFLRLAL
jgi:hypothetical protein